MSLCRLTLFVDRPFQWNKKRHFNVPWVEFFRDLCSWIKASQKLCFQPNCWELIQIIISYALITLLLLPSSLNFFQLFQRQKRRGIFEKKKNNNTAMTSLLFNLVRLKVGTVLCFVRFTKENLFGNQLEWSLSHWRTQKVIYNSRHKAPILDNHI